MYLLYKTTRHMFTIFVHEIEIVAAFFKTLVIVASLIETGKLF